MKRELAGKIKTSFRNFMTILILSCLIWVYADQVTTERMTAKVTLKVLPAPGSDLIVKLQKPKNQQVDVTFAGPRAQLDKLKKDLDGKFVPVYYVKTREASEPILTKDTEEIIRDNLYQHYRAIAVESVDIDRIKISVDKYIWVTMPVKVITGTVSTSEPVINPQRVRVKIPRSIHRSLDEDKQIITLDIHGELQTKMSEQEIDEEFSLPQILDGQQIETDPSRVKVQLKILRRFSKVELKRPIEILAPIELFQKYRLELREHDITVPLFGPAELIDNIKDEDVVVYIEIVQGDLINSRNSYFPRRVKFRLPEGIKLDKEKMPRAPEVDFKLTEQKTAPENP